MAIPKREQPARVRKRRRNMLFVSSARTTLLRTPRTAKETVSEQHTAPSTTWPWLPGNKLKVYKYKLKKKRIIVYENLSRNRGEVGKSE